MQSNTRDWFAANLVPFLTGFALGSMATLATFSGRIASLESVTQSHTEALRDIRTDIKTISDKLDGTFFRTFPK